MSAARGDSGPDGSAGGRADGGGDGGGDRRSSGPGAGPVAAESSASVEALEALRGAVKAAEASAIAHLKAFVAEKPDSGESVLVWLEGAVQRVSGLAEAIGAASAAGAAQLRDDGHVIPVISLNGLAAAGGCIELMLSVCLRSWTANQLHLPYGLPVGGLRGLKVADGEVKALGELFLSASPSARQGAASSCVNAVILFAKSDESVSHMLPRLLPDLVAAMIVLKHDGSTGPEVDIRALLFALPVNVVVPSLFGIVMEVTGAPAWFSKSCGQWLSRSVMRPQGVEAVVSSVAGALESGDSKAIAQVATLLSRVPLELVTAEEYFSAIGPQLRAMLRLTGDDVARVLSQVAAASIASVASRSREGAMWTLVPLLVPLRRFLTGEVTPAASSILGRRVVVNSSTVERCVEDLHRLFSLATVRPTVAGILSSDVEALLALHRFALGPAPTLADATAYVLRKWLLLAPKAAEKLASIVAKGGESLPSEFVCDDSGQVAAVRVHVPDESGGDSNGAAIRMPGTLEGEAAEHASIITLLASIGDDGVSGDVFVVLLDKYLARRLDVNLKESVEARRESYRQHKRAVAFLLSLVDELGEKVLSHAGHALQSVHAILTATILGMGVELATSDGPTKATMRPEDASEMLTLCLTILVSIMQVGDAALTKRHRSGLLSFLVPLSAISEIDDTDTRELAIGLRTSIITFCTDQPSAKRNIERTGAGASGSEVAATTLGQEIDDSVAETADSHPAVQGGGMQRLIRLIRRGGDEVDAQVDRLYDIFMRKLEHDDSYVFLAATAGLAAIADMYGEKYISTLLEAFCDEDMSLHARIKLGESLRAAAHRCGDMLPRYAQALVRGYIQAAVPPRLARAEPPKPQAAEYKPIRSTAAAAPPKSSRPLRSHRIVFATATEEERAHFRASVLSNLAEVCRVLGRWVEPYISEVSDACRKILLWESKGDALVRRAAVYAIEQALEGAGVAAVTVMARHMSALEDALETASSKDTDAVVRGHAATALNVLTAASRAALTPSETKTLRVGIRPSGR